MPDERVHYSDNYVEVEPSEERTITLTGPADAQPAGGGGGRHRAIDFAHASRVDGGRPVATDKTPTSHWS